MHFSFMRRPAPQAGGATQLHAGWSRMKHLSGQGGGSMHLPSEVSVIHPAHFTATGSIALGSALPDSPSRPPLATAVDGLGGVCARAPATQATVPREATANTKSGIGRILSPVAGVLLDESRHGAHGVG